MLSGNAIGRVPAAIALTVALLSMVPALSCGGDDSDAPGPSAEADSAGLARELVENLGSDDAAIDALLLAFERGYSASQVETAVGAGTLAADGVVDEVEPASSRLQRILLPEDERGAGQARGNGSPLLASRAARGGSPPQARQDPTLLHVVVIREQMKSLYGPLAQEAAEELISGVVLGLVRSGYSAEQIVEAMILGYWVADPLRMTPQSEDCLLLFEDLDTTTVLRPALTPASCAGTLRSLSVDASEPVPPWVAGACSGYVAAAVRDGVDQVTAESMTAAACSCLEAAAAAGEPESDAVTGCADEVLQPPGDDVCPGLPESICAHAGTHAYTTAHNQVECPGANPLTEATDFTLEFGEREVTITSHHFGWTLTYLEVEPGRYLGGNVLVTFEGDSWSQISTNTCIRYIRTRVD